MICGSKGRQQEINMSHPPLTFFISGEHMRWMDRGRCNGTPNWQSFFADERAQRRGLPAEVPPDVMPLCGVCDVRNTCLTWALEHDEEGVWGGTTKQQREAMKRPIVRAKCPACQGRWLFRTGIQQVCGDCGASWAATKIHGNAKAEVVLPEHPARDNVIQLPSRRPVYLQASLFEVVATKVAVCRRRSCRRRKHVGFEQLQIPGVGTAARSVVQVRTKPVVSPRAAAA
jgi:WhiB family transcriptional regulator, redox-sensing transcriptional regulator